MAVAVDCETRGAGEIVLNSIDNDGMMTGYDLDLPRRVRERIGVQMSVLGGAGKLDDMVALIQACGVVGAAAGSMFVFKGPRKAVLINYPNMETKDELIRRAAATA